MQEVSINFINIYVEYLQAKVIIWYRYGVSSVGTIEEDRECYSSRFILLLLPWNSVAL